MNRGGGARGVPPLHGWEDEMKTRSVVVTLCAALVAGVGSAFACGYHPGLTSSTFDAVHPRSLGVAVALHRAQAQGVLPAEPAKPGLQGFPGTEYRHAVRELQDLQARLAKIALHADADKEGTAKDESRRFAFVFVRSRLWAQYKVGPDGASVQIHSAPAEAGEAVVLSDESVLDAIAAGRLTFRSAVDQGLLQFADDRDEQVHALLTAAFAVAFLGQ